MDNMIGQLPPGIEANQKILDPDIMDILVSNAPKSHRELMTDQGFDAQTATTDQFVEICGGAETKEALRSNKLRRYDQDDSSPEDERLTRKPTKKHCKADSFKNKWLPYYCKEHGSNTMHDSKDCKVIHGSKKEPNNWKKKETSNSTDYKSKYKRKTRELNLLCTMLIDGSLRAIQWTVDVYYGDVKMCYLRLKKESLSTF